MDAGAHAQEPTREDVGAGASLAAAIAGAVFVLAVIGYSASPQTAPQASGALARGDAFIPISYSQGLTHIEWRSVEQPASVTLTPSGLVPATIHVKAGVPVALAVRNAPSGNTSVSVPEVGYVRILGEGTVTLPALEAGVYRVGVGAGEFWGTLVAE